jgi:hypothetical protein
MATKPEAEPVLDGWWPDVAKPAELGEWLQIRGPHPFAHLARHDASSRRMVLTLAEEQVALSYVS